MSESKQILITTIKEWVNINSYQAKSIIKGYLKFLMGGAALETRTKDFLQKLIEDLADTDNDVIQWDGKSNNIRIDMDRLGDIYKNKPDSYLRNLNLKGFTKIAHVEITKHLNADMIGKTGIIEAKSKLSDSKDSYRVYLDDSTEPIYLDKNTDNVKRIYPNSNILYYSQIPDSNTFKSYKDTMEKSNKDVIIPKNPLSITRSRTPPPSQFPLMAAAADLESPLQTNYHFAPVTSSLTSPQGLMMPSFEEEMP